jgi:Uma2 family endonuclease
MGVMTMEAQGMMIATEPQVLRWSRRDYNQMARVGLLADKHVELIEGQVIVMSPMGSLHATTVALAAKVVEPLFGPSYFVRWQMPLAIGPFSEPEPDIALIKDAIRDYATDHPTTAALIIEVADTSLSYDWETKGSLYAKAGIADYWIINLVDHRLEVYRQPAVDEGTAYGYRYAQQNIFTGSDAVSPLEISGSSLIVSDLLS